MRTSIAILPGFGRIKGYQGEFNEVSGRVSDAIQNNDLPEDVKVFRLPRHLGVVDHCYPDFPRSYRIDYCKIVERRYYPYAKFLRALRGFRS